MAEDNHQGPGLATLLRRLAQTGVGALHNRGELLAVEWQEERAHRVEYLLAAMAFAFMSFMAAALLTAIIIFLCPPDTRLYVAGGFTLLYLLGGLWAGVSLKSKLKRRPFAASLDQLKKDREWLESSK